jgi:hypothetical protein
VTFFFGYNRGIASTAAIKEAFSLDRYAGSAVTMWMDEYVESTFTSDGFK